MADAGEAAAFHQAIAAGPAVRYDAGVRKMLVAQAPGVVQAAEVVAVAGAAARPQGPLARQHERHRFRLQYLTALMVPLIHQHQHELRQLAGRDAQAALRAEQGAVGAHDVVLQPRRRKRRLDVEIVGLRDPRALRVPAFVAVLLAAPVQRRRILDPGWREVGQVEAGLQTHRIEHQAPHQAVEAFATGALHDGGDDAGVEIDVFEVAPRRMGAGPHGALAVQASARLQDLLQVDRGVELEAALVAQRGGVREQHAQGDRLVREVRVAQPVAEPGADVLVQRQPALLDQLHGAQRGHQLGHRGDAEHRIGIHRLRRQGSAGQALVAELAAVDDLAATDRHHRQAGQRDGGVVDDGLQSARQGLGLGCGQGRGCARTGQRRQSKHGQRRLHGPITPSSAWRSSRPPARPARRAAPSPRPAPGRGSPGARTCRPVPSSPSRAAR